MNLVLIKLDSRDKVYFVYTERIIKTEQTKSEAGKKKKIRWKVGAAKNVHIELQHADFQQFRTLAK